MPFAMSHFLFEMQLLSCCARPQIWSACDAGAKVIAFTAHRTAPLSFADTIVRLPARATATPANIRSFAGGSSAAAAQPLLHSSVMPMGTVYELALKLLLDTFALMLQREINISEDLMKSRTSNLE